MKNINRNTIIIALATLVVGLILGWLLFGGKSSPNHDHKITETKQRVWTCSMHPSVRQNEPGKCPICGMDLIPLEADHGEENPLEIKMSAVAIKLANIQTSIVGAENPVKEILLNGKVQTDEKNVYTQTSHIAGRIEELQISFTGEKVKNGQVIANIYSPDLVLAQKELFEAYKIKESQAELYEAAREKLKNWKLTDQQIDKILQNGQPTEQFPILSDIDGVVLKKNVNLGDYVQKGTPLFEIADLSRLWVMFEVHESEMNMINVGDEIKYRIHSLPGEDFTGKISFIDPVIDPKTRVARARINVYNKSLKLKPEMFVTGYLADNADSGDDEIVIPKTAVMWTGKRSIVYVKHLTDVGVSFEMREVTLGPALGDHYLIEDGLEEGEEIASYGTFSIDAAAQLAGKPSMMNTEMKMTSGEPATVSETTMDHSAIEIKPIPVDTEVRSAFQPVIEDYLKLKDALVNDDYEEAKKQAEVLSDQLDKIKMSMFEGEAHQAWMQHGMEAKSQLKEIANSKNIGGARAVFKPFSQHMIMLAKIFNPYNQKLYIQHCPMADDFKGADWLSTEENIMNPYFGDEMLQCGTVKEAL